MKQNRGMGQGGKIVALWALVLALCVPGVQAATNGFAQTGAGPYDYNDTANWVGNTINGVWDTSLTVTQNQTVTFGADTTLLTPLTFNYAGSIGLTLRSDGITNRMLTLGSDITVNPVMNTSVSLGSATANQNLNINLGGVTRTLTVNASKALNLYSSVTNGALVLAGGGNFFLFGPNYQTATTLTNGGLYLDGTAVLGTGTLTICNGTTIGNNTGITTNGNNNPMAWNGSFTFVAAQNLHLGTGPVSLAAPMTLTMANWTLTVGGAISGGNGIFDVTKAGAATFVYNPATALTTNQTVNVSAGTETLNGAISGSSYSLTKVGAGTLNLNGANTYGGGTVINSGIVQFGAGAVPSSGFVALNAGAVLNAVGAYANAGAWVASGKIAANSAGALTLTGADSSNIDFSAGPYTALYLGASANATLSGTITAGVNGYFLGGGGATLTLSAANALSGNQPIAIGGNVTLTTSNSVSGLATVGSGTLTLANTNGALVNDDMIVKSGATLALDSSVSGVRGATRAKSVTLRGGTLTVTGNSGTNSVDTITGALTIDATSLYNGVDIITLTNGAGRNCQLSANSLVRTNNGVVLVRGNNLGQNTIASATANSVNVSLGTAPVLAGGGGLAGSQNISIIPWVIGDTSAVGGGSSFVTYDTANGIRPLAAGEYDASIAPGTTPITDNISLALGATTTTVTGAATVNSLLLSGTTGGNLAGAGALTVASGAIYGNISGSGFTISGSFFTSVGE